MWPSPQETTYLVTLTEEILLMENFISCAVPWSPPWINNKIKSLIKNKTEYFKNFFKPNNPVSIRHFEKMLDALRKNIEVSKQKCYSNFSRKLAVNKINLRCYWSILKSFLNDKKNPCIPSLIHNHQFVVNFEEKSELFNSFFAKQCTHIETGSNLPTQILRRTNESLSTINFTWGDILSVIRKLDPNGAHGHDHISIRMLLICGKAICKPLYFTFSSCM